MTWLKQKIRDMISHGKSLQLHHLDHGNKLYSRLDLEERILSW